jgi:translation elongation factor EF-Tu-like GTPase
MFKKSVDMGQAGDNLGLLIRGCTKKEVERGMVTLFVKNMKKIFVALR